MGEELNMILSKFYLVYNHRNRKFDISTGQAIRNSQSNLEIIQGSRGEVSNFNKSKLNLYLLEIRRSGVNQSELFADKARLLNIIKAAENKNVHKRNPTGNSVEIW